MIKTLVAPCVFLLVTACTNQELYEFSQDSRASECHRLQESPAHLQDCLDRVGVSYDDYEQQRREVLELDQ